MIRLRTSRSRARVRALATSTVLGALGGFLFSGCDNPACIFSEGGCQTSSGGGAGAVSAAFPEPGEWLVDGAPRVDSMFPQGVASSTTPIVVIFSESMTPSSVSGAFALQEVGGVVTGGTAISGTLVGDGRVLVLLPPPLTAAAEYQVVFAEGAEVRDLTGSLALRPSDGVVGSFTVAAEPTLLPTLVATWPGDGNLGQSDITEIVAVFDRPLDPTTVDAESWQVVHVASGDPPEFNPLPTALIVAAGGGGVQETRVWRWTSLDTDTSRRATLGASSLMRLNLSPADAPIATPDGDEMVFASIEFTTQSFSTPASAQIISDPGDAVGIENLNGVMPLMIEVDLAAEEILEGDVLEIAIFGAAPDTGETEGGAGENEETIQVLLRELVLTAEADSVVLLPGDLQLLLSSDPLVAQFQDGDLSFAFNLRRGEGITPLTVLDVDPDTEGVQDAVLDTVAPEFLGLVGVSQGSTDYQSDMRDLVVIGTASEELRTVEIAVDLPDGVVDNRVDGELPPLPAMTANGEFIAASCPTGLLEPDELPANFSGVLYDRALNASEPFSGSYTQYGACGPGDPLPGSGLDVVVSVYDWKTRLPLAGATVYSHESVGGVLSPNPPDPKVTDQNGRVVIASAPTGQTLITVELDGFDLFTFQNVATPRLDVILMPSEPTTGFVKPVATGPGDYLASAFNSTWLADSRGLLPGDTAFAGEPCTYNPLLDQSVCTFEPAVPIRALRLGLLSFLATKEPADPNNPNAFSAASFLQSFSLDFPRPRVSAGSLDVLALSVGPALSGPDVDPEDIPLGTPPKVLVKSADYAFSFPNPVGAPRVSVEALVLGLPGTMTAGLGKAYFNALDDGWDLRAGYSALVKAGGELVSLGVIEDDLFLRAEYVDLLGSRSGARTRLSAGLDTLSPSSIPLLVAPPPAGAVSGTSYDLVYDDVFAGTRDGQGLYRVTLIDSTGRRWTLWQPDPADGEGPVSAHLPPIEAAGGEALSHGSITCIIEGWAWSAIDFSSFLWTDVEREHDQFFTSAPILYDQVAP